MSMCKRAFLRIILLIGPVILLSGYAVYWANNRLIADGVRVHPLVYQFVLLVVMWVAMWLTSKPLVDELRERAKKRQAERNKAQGP